MRHRELLERLYHAGVEAADPYRAVRSALGQTAIGARPWVIALGKGAVPMARGALDALSEGQRMPQGGLVVAATDVGGDVAPLQLLVGDHPVPGGRSAAASRALAALVGLVRPGDDVLVLLSGGASSLIASPVDGVSAADLAGLFDGLLRSGASIGTMNALRKRVLRWGAGRLAEGLAGARTTVLVASDVIGDEVASIASGPCTADVLRAADLVDLADQHHLGSFIPPGVRDYLDDVLRGARPETPKSSAPCFDTVIQRVVLNNATALDGIVAAAGRLGVAHVHLAPTLLLGPAASTGEAIARACCALRAGGAATLGPPARCLVWGGETTVRIESGTSGIGGRSQELALAAARVLARAEEPHGGVALLAAGTDGRDGPTDAAGATVDADTWWRIVDAGIDPELALRQHDAGTALDAAAALFRPGASGTNANDVVIALVD